MFHRSTRLQRNRLYTRRSSCYDGTVLVRKLSLDHLAGQDRPKEPETGARTEDISHKSGGSRATLQVSWLWTAWLLLAGLFLYLVANPTLP